MSKYSTYHKQRDDIIRLRTELQAKDGALSQCHEGRTQERSAYDRSSALMGTRIAELEARVALLEERSAVQQKRIDVLERRIDIIMGMIKMKNPKLYDEIVNDAALWH